MQKDSNIVNHPWLNKNSIDFGSACVIDNANKGVRKTAEYWHTSIIVGTDNNSKPLPRQYSILLWFYTACTFTLLIFRTFIPFYSFRFFASSIVYSLIRALALLFVNGCRLEAEGSFLSMFFIQRRCLFILICHTPITVLIYLNIPCRFDCVRNIPLYAYAPTTIWKVESKSPHVFFFRLVPLAYK